MTQGACHSLTEGKEMQQTIPDKHTRWAMAHGLPSSIKRFAASVHKFMSSSAHQPPMSVELAACAKRW